MPILSLPIFPSGVSYINDRIAFSKDIGKVYYFNGLTPIFSHDENDIQSFRMITSQFHINGNATQAEIARAFGVTTISIKRAVSLYRQKGPKGFYEPRRTRGAPVLTQTVIEEAQNLFDDGLKLNDVADQLGVKRDTLRKAVASGRASKKKS